MYVRGSSPTGALGAGAPEGTVDGTALLRFFICLLKTSVNRRKGCAYACASGKDTLLELVRLLGVPVPLAPIAVPDASVPDASDPASVPAAGPVVSASSSLPPRAIKSPKCAAGKDWPLGSSLRAATFSEAAAAAGMDSDSDSSEIVTGGSNWQLWWCTKWKSHGNDSRNSAPGSKIV